MDPVRLPLGALALYLFLSTHALATAAAQPHSVLVLPFSLADEDATIAAARAEAVADAIPTGELVPIASSDARARFEEHGSAEPATLSDGELDRWLALSRQAIRQLASTDYAGAAQTLRDAQALSEPAAAELNREETRARQMLDTCLFEVRGLLETHDARAETRALACRRLVPRLSPSPFIHTPEVVDLMRRIDARLAAAPPGSLRIESDPSGCRVRLNGIAVGETPFASTDLAPGEYRAQIECGDGAHHGRIHRIRLGEGVSTVHVGVRFDDVVRADTSLRLVYPSARDADAHRLADALQVARTIGAAEVWLVSADADEAVGIDRVSTSDGEVIASARAQLASGLSHAVATLLDSPVEEPTTPPPTDIAASITSRRADWELGVGITVGVLGVGGFVTSFALVSAEGAYGRLATQPLTTDPDYLARRRAWTDWEVPALAAGWIGGALVTTALPLVMGDEQGTPWWSWAIGGAGLAIVGAGVGIAVSASSCGSEHPTEACVDGTGTRDVGSTLASMGMPLLSVPLVYLLREIAGGALPITPSVSAGAGGASVSVGGEW